MNFPMKSQSRPALLYKVKCIGIFHFFIAFLLFSDGCKKQTTSIHNFSGIVAMSETGTIIGTWGIDDGDWSTDNSWSEEEYNVLDFPDTVSLDNTFIKDTTGWNNGTGIHEQPRNSVVAYPIPANDRLSIAYRGFGIIKFKVAIVDSYFNPLFTYASNDGNPIELNISDSTVFKNGTIYRMYYSLSVKDSLNYYKGHGDILICRESVLQECKKFVP